MSIIRRHRNRRTAKPSPDQLPLGIEREIRQLLAPQSLSEEAVLMASRAISSGFVEGIHGGDIWSAEHAHTGISTFAEIAGHGQHIGRALRIVIQDLLREKNDD